ncbi:YbeD family protein [Psychrobacter sp. T6-5]|uniref:YbeD family protein n=1 Tax=Psychrobacter sp. T6-5 TaxID=3457451 RepID=UPI003FD53423
MSDDSKDNNDNNANNLTSNQPSVKVTDLTPNKGVLKGKKTDIQNPELWEFPMNYPLSIIGHEGEHESLLNEIKLILGSQFPDFDLASIEVKPSRTGRFHSARVNLYLTAADQVNTLYASLDNAKTVRMVL